MSLPGAHTVSAFDDDLAFLALRSVRPPSGSSVPRAASAAWATDRASGLTQDHITGRYG